MVLYKVSLLIPSGGLIYLHKMTNLPFNLCISTDKFSISHVLKSQECPFTGDLMIAFSLDAMVAGDGLLRVPEHINLALQAKRI